MDEIFPDHASTLESTFSVLTNDELTVLCNKL